MDEFKMTIENHELAPLLRSFFPVEVPLSSRLGDSPQVHSWLTEHLGGNGLLTLGPHIHHVKFDIYPRRRWALTQKYFSPQIYRFRDPADAVLFKMRWG